MALTAPVSVGRHPVHGIVAHNETQNPAADYVLRGLGFARVPGHYLYQLQAPETEKVNTAVRVLRTAGYEVRCDAALDPDLDSAAQAAAPAQAPAPETPAAAAPLPPEPAVVLSRHPLLGIVATELHPTASAPLHLADAGFHFVAGLGLHVLPYDTSPHAGQQAAAMVHNSLRAEGITALISPAVSTPVASSTRPAALATWRTRAAALGAQVADAARRALGFAVRKVSAFLAPGPPPPLWAPGSLPTPGKKAASGMVWQQVPLAAQQPPRAPTLPPSSAAHVRRVQAARTAAARTGRPRPGARHADSTAARPQTPVGGQTRHR